MSEILVVEDQADAAKAIGTLVDWQGNTSLVAHSKEEAIKALESVNFQAVIIDRGLPDGDGLDLIPLIRRLQPKCFVLLFTGRDDNPEPRRFSADPNAPDEVLTKPIGSTQQILDAISGLPEQEAKAAVTGKVEPDPLADPGDTGIWAPGK